MTLALTQIDLISGKINLCRDLDVSQKSSNWRTGVVSECIRQYLHGRRENTHTSAITGSLRRCLEPYLDVISPDKEDGSINFVDCLDNLATSGDIFRASGGYWKTCPTRLVPLPRDKAALVVGGAPSAYLREKSNLRPTSFGRARIVGADSIPDKIHRSAENWQTVFGWLGCPKAPIGDWTKAELKRAEFSLSSGLLEGAEDMRVYLPDKRCVNQFRTRWVQLMEAQDFCRVPRVCRATLFEHGRASEYFVAQLVHHKSADPTFLSVRIEQDVAVRLLYGMDSLARNPLPASWRSIGKEEFILEFYRRWPEAESRILSLGDRIIDAERDSKKMYLFPNKLASFVRVGLKRLDMDIRVE